MAKQKGKLQQYGDPNRKSRSRSSSAEGVVSDARRRRLKTDHAAAQEPQYRKNQEGRAIARELRIELANEQLKLSRELDEYIAQFKSRVHVLNNDRALVAIFVHYLHPRWKRLVEPEEYRFRTWQEAANAAKYHAKKYNVLLGARCTDEERLFSGRAVGFLRSNFFAPRYERKTTESSAPRSESLPVDAKDSIVISENEDQAASANEQSFESMEVVKEQQQQQQDVVMEYSEQGGASSMSAANASTATTADATAATDATSTPQPSAQNIYYHVPPEHKGTNLAFLELPIKGQIVRALLSKKRWGASVMSKALQERLGLELKESLAFGIVTDFGIVDETLGGAKLEIGHPKMPNQLKHELLFQVLPSIYGGRVDMILGADFFHLFQATFKVEQMMINLMGQDTPFVTGVL